MNSELHRRTLLIGGGTAAAVCATSSLWSGLAHAAPGPRPLAPPEPSRGSLWYRRPATAWAGPPTGGAFGYQDLETRAKSLGTLPIGNGRLGATTYGNVWGDRFHLNEQSLWAGANNWDGEYDLSMNGFGSYRVFGDLVVAVGVLPPVVTADHGGATVSNGEGPDAGYDGNPSSKWCLVAPQRGNVAWQVKWQVELGAPAVVSEYAFTSANDVPARDPQNWSFEGSQDGDSWDALDTRTHATTPFTSRKQQLTFSCGNTTAYRFYRFTFAPKLGVSHWQVAEIALTGVSLRGTEDVPADYVRALDPATGVHTTSYTLNGARYVREAFASRESDILVLRYRTDAAEGLTGSISLTSAQHVDNPIRAPHTVVSDSGNRISFAGEMGNRLRHAADVRVFKSRGSLSRADDAVRFEGCEELELRVDLRTDYALDAVAGWRSGQDPAVVAAKSLQRTSHRSYTSLLRQQERAFGAIMSRVSVDWGKSSDEVAAMPTNERMARYGVGTSADPELEQMLFAYGRYLLAASSRPNGLPANLQGLWCNDNAPAWGADYHTNINIQMNYWGAETTDLGDSHEALAHFIEQVAIPSRVATRASFGDDVPGWTARTSQSIFGGNGWAWNTISSAWYMQHLYEHWKFTQDADFLARYYPLVKEICQFWEHELVEKEDGKLYAPMGWSPEHGPREDGVLHDQQIIWELFTGYLEMAQALGTDADYQATVTRLREKLAGNKIGSWGQLQEWQTDRDVRTGSRNGINALHRHTSHLFAVYPGRQISVEQTPELAAAALTSLNARCGVPDGGPIGVDTVGGDSRRSWTYPWRLALFARLREPERAYMMLRGLVRHSTLTNLWTTHPPFQIDGNFGITGALVELLLQSHDGTIRILPSVPEQWAAQGSFSGLRARGGYRVSARWQDGQVTWFEVVADRTKDRSPVTVVVNGEEQVLVPANN